MSHEEGGEKRTVLKKGIDTGKDGQKEDREDIEKIKD